MSETYHSVAGVEITALVRICWNKCEAYGASLK